MSEKDNKTITRWLMSVCIMIMAIVVFGGFVRLTRSGLSIVEWNPISGVVPPIGETAWQQEFAKYQQTPEFQKVNNDMDLAGYKKIFYVEYIHRLVARIIGLIVVIPIFYYLFKGVIPWKKSAVYLWIGLLFGFQGFMGWYMVSSGLKDVPAVSHFRLTIHLFMALFLLGLTFWTMLNHYYKFPKLFRSAYKSTSFRISLFVLFVLVFQIGYGGLVAGLKAGHASNTFPLMFGYWIPPGLLSQVEPWWQNLIAVASTVHFVHRWFAFVVLGASIYQYVVAKRQNSESSVAKGYLWLLWLVGLQITLGATVVWFNVNIVLALVHQATAMLLFLVSIYISYQIVHEPVLATSEAQRKLAPQRA